MILTEDIIVSLKDYFHDKKVNTNDFLKIAISVSEELAETHTKNIIHNDINPKNIIVDTKTKKAFIKQSMISIKAHSEKVNAKLEKIDGNLRYIPPEQTGLVNQPLDFRSDLYSLGAVFYEMLTTRPPFSGENPAELIHANVAMKPISPHNLNKNVPEQISAIVCKLLAKTPNERYQSAFGLLVDLKRCQKQLNKYAKIKTFSIGKNDISAVFEIPKKLYGREKEFTLIQKLFSRLKNGNSQILMISGVPGIGKTFLVQESQKLFMKESGWFISGKFDQYRKNVSYAAIIDIFRQLIRQLLGKTNQEIELFKRKLLKTLNRNAQIIIDVIPELELIIGNQKQVEKLPANENRNRFHYTLRNFIKVFADKSTPLVFFLDDLQWADTASIELIDSILSDRRLQAIMFIGAFRNIEAEKNSALVTIITELQQNRKNYQQLKLTPIAKRYLAIILKDTLKKNIHENDSLVQLIFDKTCGNPLFVREFLINLHKNGVITYNNNSKVYYGSLQNFGWQVNMDKINNTGLPETVVDILTGRIKILPSETLDILKLASCFGLDFSPDILSKISGKYINPLLVSLQQAIVSGLIIKKADKFMFIHDEVQEVIYSLIDDTVKKTHHYHIGKLLLNIASETEITNDIDSILYQLNLGKSLLNHEERNRLIDLNLKAGKKSKVSTASDAAVHFLKQGLALLPDNSWISHYQTTLTYYLELAEAEYLCRNFDEADGLFAIILDKATSTVDRLKLYELKLDCYNIQLRHHDVLNTAKSAMQELAFSLPAKIGKLTVLKEKIKISRKLNKKNMSAILNLPTITNTEIINLISIMVKIANAVYSSYPYLFIYLVIKGIDLSLKYGHCQGTAYFYSSFAPLCCQSGILQNIDRAYQLSKLSLNLNNKYYSSSLHTKILFTSIFVTHWKEPLKNNLDYYQQIIDLCLNSGNSQYLNFSYLYYSSSYLLMGKTLKETVDLFNKYNDHNKKWASLNLDANFILVKQAFNNNSKKAGDGLFLALFYLNRVIQFYMYEEYKKGIDLCRKERYFNDSLYLNPTAPIYYFFYALHLAADYLSPKPIHTKISHYYKLLKIKSRFKKWAQYNKSTYYPMYILIAAEIARVQKKHADAVNLYKEAIELTEENGFLYCQAIALECMGRFYCAEEMLKDASRHINEAYNCYKLWGAATKARIMTEKYPDLISSPKKITVENFDSEKVMSINSQTETCSITNLDLQSITEGFHLLAAGDDVHNTLKNLLRILIQKSGAERVLLLLERNNRLYAELECLVENSQSRVIFSPGLRKENYPESICRYVMRAKKLLLLSNVSRENDFVNDPYFLAQKPKSILCIPVKWMNTLVAVVYMENNTSSNLFALNRHELLKNIVNQIAMFIENSQREKKQWTDHKQSLANPDLSLQKILKKEYQLTNQEIKVVLLFKEGFSRKEICQKLNIASQTLRSHLKCIYNKTIKLGYEETEKAGRVDKISRLLVFLNKLE